MKKQRPELLEYLKLAEETEAEYNGIETDTDSENTDTEEPYEVQNIRVAQKMITVFQIEHWIMTKGLNLTPEYQRNLVWDEERKSALIESLLLRIPIPAFYLDEDTELAVNILDEKCPQMVKFDVFRRVNTGGLPLNFQEIRNIMALPKVRTLLRNMVECEEFWQATRGGVKDVRMGAQELCLRYLTILFAYDWNKRDFYYYHGLLKMMDQMILDLNAMSESELEKLFQDFRQAMRNCHIVLGEYSFSKIGNNKINKSLFTGWAVVLANMKPDMADLQNNIEELRGAYSEYLEKDTEFYHAITSSTGTRRNILISIEVIRALWENYHDKSG